MSENKRTARVWTLMAATGLGTAALLAAAGATASESYRPLDGNRVMITDFSGKPPFKRRVVSVDELSDTQLARFEEVAAPAVDESRVGERVTIVDYRGRPPFKRTTVEIDASNVTELARFEEATTERAEPRRPRFPGKTYPIRRTR